MKTFAKLCAALLIACFFLIYVLTMPATLTPLEHERNELEVKDMVERFQGSVADRLHKSQQQGVADRLQQQEAVNSERTVKSDNLYHDPYINVKYKVVTDGVIGQFEEESYIEGSAHDSDPFKLNSFDQQKSDSIGKLWVLGMTYQIR